MPQKKAKSMKGGSSKIYCGIGNVPKKSKRGTMKECVDSGQIRYYGIKKVDPRLVEHMLHAKSKQTTLRQLQGKKIRLMARIKKLIAQIKKETNIKKKDKMKDEVRKIAKEHDTYVRQIDKLNRQAKKPKRKSKKTSKKTSKKRSKKTSKKKTSKKTSKKKISKKKSKKKISKKKSKKKISKKKSKKKTKKKSKK